MTLGINDFKVFAKYLQDWLIYFKGIKCVNNVNQKKMFYPVRVFLKF